MTSRAAIVAEINLAELQSRAPQESDAIARKKPKNDIIAASRASSTRRIDETTMSHTRTGRRVRAGPGAGYVVTAPS